MTELKLFQIIINIQHEADLEKKRVISKKQGLEKAKKLGIDFFEELSTKSGFGPQEIFVEAGKILYNDYNCYKSHTKPKNKQSDVKFEKLNKYLNF